MHSAILKRLLGAALLGLAFLANAANSPLQSKTGTITTQNLVAGGACTAGGCVEVDVATAGALTVQVTGTYTGALSAQITTNGTEWVTLGSTSTFTRLSTGVASATISSGQQDVYQVASALGARRFRITALAAVTGTATIVLQPVELSPGASTTISGGAGDASAAKQDTGNASLASIDTKTPALGQALAASSTPVVLPAAQITTLTPPAAITGYATSAKQSDGSQKSQIVDGSGNVIGSTSNALNVAITSGGGSGGTASTVGAAAPATATAAGLSDGTNMQLPRVFDGDSGAGTQYVAGAILRKSASGGTVEAGTSSDPLRVDPTGTTNQPVALKDGSGNAVTSAARGSERAISVQIVDGSGAQVTTFGGSGGTASTVGSATPSTATAIGGSDGTNMQVPRVADLDTGAGSQYSLVVSPRIGASGGGVELTAGAGAVAAGTLRVTQASDSPVVSVLGATGDAAATQGSTGSVSAKLREMSASLGTINTSLGTINTTIGSTNSQLPASLGTAATASSLSTAMSTSDAGPVTAGTATATRGVVAVGTYNSTPVTVTNTQQVGAQMDANGYLKVNVAAGSSSGTVTQGSTTSGQSGMLTQGAVTTSAPTYTTGQTSPFSLDTSGNLRVAVSGGAGSTITGTTAHDAVGTSINPVLIGGIASAAAPTDVSADGDLTRPWYLRSGAQATQATYAGVLAVAGNGTTTSGTQRVTIASDSTGTIATTNAGTFAVQPAGSVAHDAAATSVNPVLTGGYASAAAPTNVSADGDSVRTWMLRSGATVNQPSFAGVLASAGSGVNGTGVQRVTIATDDTIVAATNTKLDTLHTDITSTNTQLPAALGATTASASLPVVLATDATSIVAQGSTTSGQKGSLVQGAVTTSAPTYTTAQTAPLSLDTSGALRVTGAGGGTQYTEDAAAASDPVGNMMMAVRRDTLSTTEVSADGDNIALKASKKGALYTTGEDGVIITATATGNAVMTNGTIDMTGFSSAYVNITVVGGTINFECSNDSAGTFVTAAAYLVNGLGTVAPVTFSSTVNSIYRVPKCGKYLQLRVSSYASGTVTALVMPTVADINPFVSANIGGGQTAHDGAATGNPVRIGGYASAAAPSDVSADGDAVNAWMLRNGATATQPTYAGVLAVAGNGTSTSGTQRVVLASDNSAVSGLGAGATGSAVPANAVYTGARSGANLVGIIQGDTTVAVNMTSATTTQVVALSGSTKIYVTSYHLVAEGAGGIKFSYGTGTNCGTGTTELTGNMKLSANGGIAQGGGLGPVLVVPASQALCVTTDAAVNIRGALTYTQF